ncbi:MAG: amidohydrolase family protein, partial [Verrucomicrobia bacterium]|nr:amidohydrolase family protein [Verrucomicrobiota bacterium]
MRVSHRTLCLCVFLFFSSRARSETFDLVIRHGRIVDGLGNPAYFADVGIKNGRIAALGKHLGAGEKEINATGLIVAPGFIDVHTHAEDIREMPLAENFARMGVTTLVLGNCGSSMRDIAELWRQIESTGASVNVATLIGHGTIRSAAMGGSFMRPPNDEELSRMKTSVEQAMTEGALGISTGLIYLPGTFAKTEELVELAKVVARYDGIYASHMRDEGPRIFDALNELFQIAREAGVRAHVSHIKLSGPSAWGQADKVLAAIARARAEGLDITQDQYAYTASSTGLSQLVPSEAREGGNEKFTERLNDPAQKAKIVQQMKDSLRKSQRENYAYAVIANYKKDTSLNGKSVVEAAQSARGSDSLEDQIELILEIHKNGGASGVFHGINEDDLRKFLSHPNTMIASDSGVRRFNEGVPHPRGYGNNARILSRYVRELKVLRLEDAIRRMTSLPATAFKLRERGVLREGS